MGRRGGKAAAHGWVRGGRADGIGASQALLAAVVGSAGPGLGAGNGAHGVTQRSRGVQGPQHSHSALLLMACPLLAGT